MSNEKLLKQIEFEQRLIDKQPNRATAARGQYTINLALARQEAIDRGLIPGVTSEQLAALAPARDGGAVGFRDGELVLFLRDTLSGIATFADATFAANPPDP